MSGAAFSAVLVGGRLGMTRAWRTPAWTSSAVWRRTIVDAATNRCWRLLEMQWVLSRLCSTTVVPADRASEVATM